MIYIEDPTIPKPLWDALVDSSEDYGSEVKDFLKTQKGNYGHVVSATALQKPTQEAVLVGRHFKEIYVNPLDNLWHSMMGNIVHWVLEKYASKDPRYITEFRLGAEIKVNGKVCLVHGKFDLYDKQEKSIEDWKVTSGTSMMYDKKDHAIQLNILRWILYRNGYKVKKLKNIYLFPHLDKTKFKTDWYPKRHCKVIEQELMDMEEVEFYIRNRIRAQLTEKDKPDNKLTPCTDEERWIRGSSYAGYERVKSGKKGEEKPFSTKAAIRHEDMTEIMNYRDEKGLDSDNFLIKEFKGAPTKCSFCNAVSFCHQRQPEIIAEEKIEAFKQKNTNNKKK
jgi:hypothetical protein